MPDTTPDEQLASLRKQLRDSEHRCKTDEMYARRTKYDRTNLRNQIAELETQISQSK